MAYIWFNMVLEALGKRLNYDSVSNLYGNSFAKDAAKLIHAANPLIKQGAAQSGGIMDLVGISSVQIIDTTQSKEAADKAMMKQLGDISWADGLC